MENKNTSVFSNSLQMGVIVGIATIIYSVILYIFDATFNQALGYVNILILAAGIIWGLKQYRDKVLGGVISFGKCIGYGTLVGLFAAIISGIYTIVMMKFIDPELIQQLYLMMEDQMLEKGVPPEQIEQAMQMSKKFTNPTFMAIGGIFSSTAIAVVISLIAGAIMKKEPSAFEKDMAEVEDA